MVYNGKKVNISYSVLYLTGFVWRSLIFPGFTKSIRDPGGNLKKPASMMLGLCTISYRASFEICIQIRSQHDWIKPRRDRNEWA